MAVVIDQMEVVPVQAPADARPAEPAVPPLPAPNADQQLDRYVRVRCARAERLRAD